MKKPPTAARPKAPDAETLRRQVEQLQRQLEAAPGNAQTRQQLGFALHELGQHAAAVEAFAAARAASINVVYNCSLIKPWENITGKFSNGLAALRGFASAQRLYLA